MNPKFSAHNPIKPGSIKFMLLTVSVAICHTAWLAIAKLQASEDNMDHPDVSFQNAAQTQHAHNVATRAALQDPEVAKAIARAKKSRDPRDIKHARMRFREKRNDYLEKISDLRSSGLGWGNIAKQLDVHPSFLRLGHSKFMTKHNLDFTKHSQIRSEIKAATARSFKGKAIRGHAAKGSISKSKSLGIATTKGRGYNNGRGLALGHSKSKGGNFSVGHTAGHGNGHGAGNGGGNGGGRK